MAIGGSSPVFGLKEVITGKRGSERGTNIRVRGD